MKKILCIALVFLFTMSACKHHPGHGHPGNGDTTGEEIPYSSRIPIDTANKMIQSYLDGINYTVNTEETRALRYNADSLRRYLKDPAIKQIKFMFAHTLAYANSPDGNKRPDSNTHVLTMIIAGYDDQGNYIYSDNMVYENAEPCPNRCPTEGPASKDLLAQ